MSTDRISAAPPSKKRKAAHKDGGFPALNPIVPAPPACKPRFLLCSEDSKKDYNDCNQVELDSTSFGNGDDSYNVGGNEECHTPKGEEHRVPQILSCPLAPKKPRSTARIKTMEFFSLTPLELQLLFNLS
ncbi:hypothetical protein SUGI_0899750 [Cryptomeria japonica]|uniref:uncharacterized protein LOC131858227 n=1 Tax=Cryptomeria japonica TaxID=3369 RepID=UPI002414CBDF|nr:uncharacterized protein LOC131858227 [Cryptomeria japonica]GLJ43319.1 hypothetical protein SUGI_0899750 [Cryptomeria japonica]